MRWHTHMMVARGVATQTLAGSVDTYVTAPQGRSNGINRINVRRLPAHLGLTERNSLVANAAASEGDNSLRFIVIGFLEESPRVNLQSENRFNDSVGASDSEVIR